MPYTADQIARDQRQFAARAYNDQQDRLDLAGRAAQTAQMNATFGGSRMIAGPAGGGGFGGGQFGSIDSSVNYGMAKGDQDKLRGELIGNIDATREKRLAGLNEDYDILGKNALANLSDRGYSGSSMDLTTRLGTERAKQRGINDLDVDLLGQKNQAISGVGNNILGLQRGEMSRGDTMLQTLLGLYSQGGAPSNLG